MYYIIHIRHPQSDAPRVLAALSTTSTFSYISANLARRAGLAVSPYQSKGTRLKTPNGGSLEVYIILYIIYIYIYIIYIS
jgi:hypothetical protein